MYTTDGNYFAHFLIAGLYFFHPIIENCFFAETDEIVEEKFESNRKGKPLVLEPHNQASIKRMLKLQAPTV